MKRILFCAPGLSRANGISKFIMSYYDELIKHNIIIDFFLVDESIDNIYREKVENNGGNIYINKCSSKFKRISETKHNIINVLSTNNYDVVHVNLVDQYACGCILGAHSKNIENIIYHAHNPLTITKLLFVRNILNHVCKKYSTKYVACSSFAGDSVFGKTEYSIITNALDFREYKYNKKYREELKKEFGKSIDIDDKFIMGVVGRVSNQKNYKFVLKIFKKMLQKNNRCLLVWVGDGDKFDNFKDTIFKEGLTDKIILTGSRSDVHKFYSLFDCFLLPSKFEGLGIVLLESQSSGLRTITSTNVPIDTKQSDLIKYINLNEPISKWTNAILDDTEIDRIKYNLLLQHSSFSLESNIDKFVELYGGDK